MRKRLLLAAGTMTGLVGVGLLVVAMLPPDNRPGVTKANFDRIQEGMTRSEVRAIFGEPGTGSSDAFTDIEVWIATDGSEARVWFTGIVGHEEDERVSIMAWLESSETLFQKIRRWLRL